MSISKASLETLKSSVRNIYDFPRPGILFRDITTLLQDKKAFKVAVDELAKAFKSKKIDKVVGVESRGFVLGAAVAYKLGAGFVVARKKGKLPWKKHSVTYQLEYGTDSLEIHQDAIKAGERVVIIDDLIATGGTVDGVVRLVKKCKANLVGIGFVIELFDLGGVKKLKGYPVYSLIKFPGH